MDTEPLTILMMRFARLNPLLPLLVHLRLAFQILLAPIFLWGFLLADGTVSGRFWVAFVAFYVFLYGGTTAFNAFYDRDEGPVGGLERPPAVTPALLPSRCSCRR
jgi:4-hydroxybenzoate polyprenyltransferase